MGNDQEGFANDMVKMAEMFVDTVRDRAPGQLDYSEASLKVIDALLDEAGDFFMEMSPGQQKALIQQAGAYIFEVARKNFGGKYFWYNDLDQPILVTGIPDFEISLLAFEKVKGRLKNGPEDSIPFFFEGYAARVRKGEKGDKAMYV